jgi:hypothetical protein
MSVDRAPQDVRVGDAERSAAADRLSQHAADGRLTVEELEQRLEAVNAAVYARDLTALERDLPGPAPRRPRQLAPFAPMLVALVALCVAASLAVGHPFPLPLFVAFLLWRFARPRRVFY